MAMLEMPTRVSAADLAIDFDDVVVLDVRSPAEFASEHIPGSFNVPLDQLPEHAAHLRDTLARPVVLVCRSGVRAQQAEHALQSTGCTSLHVLDGGVGAWEASGRPLVRGQRKWSMERQVRGLAGALVLASALGGLLVAPHRLTGRQRRRRLAVLGGKQHPRHGKGACASSVQQVPVTPRPAGHRLSCCRPGASRRLTAPPLRSRTYRTSSIESYRTD